MKITNAKRGAAITVKVSPRAPRTELAGLMEDGTLKIRVAAPPVDDAANRALIQFLAQLLGLPRQQIDIVAGQTSERKLISLVGISPGEVDEIVAAALAGRVSAKKITRQSPRK
jgi:uncharacterized protein (TIGR00251 family)